MVRNVHVRELPVPAGPFVDRFQELWPVAKWPAMEFDRPLGVGADGGHGPIRYRCVAFEPGSSITFEFTHVSGTHTLSADGNLLRHEIVASFDFVGRVRWALVTRWLHDALLEDFLDNCEQAAGRAPATPARWSPWVRLMRWAFGVINRQSARA